jgi:hypothetical protein
MAAPPRSVRERSRSCSCSRRARCNSSAGPRAACDTGAGGAGARTTPRAASRATRCRRVGRRRRRPRGRMVMRPPYPARVHVRCAAASVSGFSSTGRARRWPRLRFRPEPASAPSNSATMPARSPEPPGQRSGRERRRRGCARSGGVASADRCRASRMFATRRTGRLSTPRAASRRAAGRPGANAGARKMQGTAALRAAVPFQLSPQRRDRRSLITTPRPGEGWSRGADRRRG